MSERDLRAVLIAAAFWLAALRSSSAISAVVW